MYSPLTSILSAGLVVLSLVLIRGHRRAWQKTQSQEGLSERDRDFARRQFRRRLQASGMIGVVGLAMFFGQFVTRWPLLAAFYWSGILLLVLWFLLLAVADMISTSQHYNRLQRDRTIEEAKLQAQLARLKQRQESHPDAEHGGNGRKPTSRPGNESRGEDGTGQGP